MDVYAYDPFVDKAKIEADGVKALDTIDELYSTCNYISLNIPANDKTKDSIDHNLLTKMPSPAILVNTARKEVVCESCLLKVYSERDDFAYISDIAPACKEEIEDKYPGRYFFTPKKMGAQTAEANINAGLAAANQIVNFFENNDTTYQVNK
jgi:D-3-phosphoglycerate dehydrogenase